jgi:hypothetical protein
MVPIRFGDLSEYREAIGTPREVSGPYWALVERGKKGHEVARASPCPNQIGQGVGVPPFLLPLPPSPLSPLNKMEGGGRILLGLES